jgi:hypothetical protein
VTSPRELVSERDRRALDRHAAVSWIQQCRQEGHPFGACLRRAACLEWQGRCYSARTLEDWYYAHQAQGFAGLEGRRRSDCGKLRALAPPLAQAIVELRKNHPGLTVTALLARLRAQGLLEPGSGCSPSTVYRFLHQQG